jgi:hypothetical protein
MDGKIDEEKLPLEQYVINLLIIADNTAKIQMMTLPGW